MYACRNYHPTTLFLYAVRALYVMFGTIEKFGMILLLPLLLLPLLLFLWPVVEAHHAGKGCTFLAAKLVATIKQSGYEHDCPLTFVLFNVNWHSKFWYKTIGYAKLAAMSSAIRLFVPLWFLELSTFRPQTAPRLWGKTTSALMRTLIPSSLDRLTDRFR